MEGALSTERAEFLARDFLQGFSLYIGFKVINVRYGEFETKLEIKPQHRQQDGFVHAGVIATMADHTMGYATYSAVSKDKRILTIEFKINFLKPASGNELFCRGKVMNKDKLIILTEAEVFSVSGDREDLVSIAMGNMAVVDLKKPDK